MKKQILFFGIFLMLASVILAQAPQSFKYQAIARDVEGNIMADQQISIKINLLQGSKSGQAVYSETHNIKTNQFGLINLEIGTGKNKTGDISAINWGLNPYFVNVEIDVNGGSDYKSIGVSQLLSVPYALYAETTGNSGSKKQLWDDNGNDISNANSGNVGIGITSPQESLHVGNNMRLDGAFKDKNGEAGESGQILSSTATGTDWIDPAEYAFTTSSNVTSNAPGSYASDDFVFGGSTLDYNGDYDQRFKFFFDKSKAAFRTGFINGTQWDNANRGLGSFASGLNTTASGTYSTAMGNSTTASGWSSTAIGNSTTAIGYYSTAMGNSTTASGTSSTAMGHNTIASGASTTAMGESTKSESYSSLAIGRFNIGGGGSTYWYATDPLFEVGIGTSNTSRANAMTILKNGNVGIGISTPTEELEVVGVITATGGNSTNWNTAFGWGDHSLAGYLTSEADPLFNASPSAGITTLDINNWNNKLGSYTETDPTFTVSPASGISSANIGEWNTAYSWGDHSLAGYLTSEADPLFNASPSAGITTLDINNWNNKLGSYTETDPEFTNWDKSSGITISESQISDLDHFTNADETDPSFTGSAAYGITNGNIGNWNTAYSWGDHSLAGYLSSVAINDLSDGKSDNSSVFLGSGAGAGTSNTGSNNVAVGINALNANESGSYNTANGYYALAANTTGIHNTAFGFVTMDNNISGSYNTAYGVGALRWNTIGSCNIGIGNNANNFNQEGSHNTIIGYEAGYGTYGQSTSRNIFLGSGAGYYETGSDKLYISTEKGTDLASGKANALIYGEFDNDLLRVNGTLDINNAYQFPTTDGTNGQVLVTNGNGALNWAANDANETDPIFNSSVASTITQANMDTWDAKLDAELDGDVTNEIQDLASVLSENNDGGGAQVKNIADPTDAQDAVTKSYIDVLEAKLAALEARVIALEPAIYVQQKLDKGETPYEIYQSDNSLLDSLYGKTYQGGLICYLNTMDGSGLVAAPSDQSTGAEWGCIGTLITGADGTAIGTGAQNTDDIEAGCTTVGTGADICANLTLNSYSDWFLPSQDELLAMYTNLYLNGLGSFVVDNIYMSSTECSWFANRVVPFYVGTSEYGTKYDLYYVRAVRAFSGTIPTFVCGDQMNDARDGNSYTTVQIGTQCWMAENLAYLPSVSPPSSESNTSPFYYVYDYLGADVAAAKATSNYQTYGVLYNWPAVMDGEASSNSDPSGVKGICPDGWHLPSHEEWEVLLNNLGGWSVAGGEMQETGTTHWVSPNTGATNSSGFTALPGGYRSDDGYFSSLHSSASFRTSTEQSSTEALSQFIYSNNTMLGYGYNVKEFGFSVRCVKD